MAQPLNNNQCSGVYIKGVRKGTRCSKHKVGTSTFCSYHKSANRVRLPLQQQYQQHQHQHQKEYCQVCRYNLDKHVSKISLGCGHHYHYKCFMIMNEDSNGFIFNNNKCLMCSYDFKDEMKRECAICLDSLITDIKKTKCNHYFHSVCISEWDSTRGCPMCRGEM